LSYSREAVLYPRQCGIGAFGPSTFPDSTSTRARSRSSRIRTSSNRLGAAVVPAPDEPEVVRFADNNGILVELAVRP